VAVGALLLSSCGDSSPEARAASKKALQGDFTGVIRDRIRRIDVQLGKSGIQPDRIIVAQGEDVELSLFSQEGIHGLQFDQFRPEESASEGALRGQSSPAAPSGDHFRLDVLVTAGEKRIVVLDADDPGEFPILCTCGAQGIEQHSVLIVQPRLFVLRWVARYGLVALFALLMFGIAGIPLPDEVMLSFAGGLAATGNYNMDYVSTLLTAFLGASCGITCSYVLGRTAGLGVVRKWGKYLHLTEERLNRVHEWYEHKKGRWALVFCIYAPVFRHVVAIVAGTSRMRLGEFVVLAWSGVLMWVATFITLGYFSAEYWVRMGPTVHYILLVGSLGIGAIILIWYILKNRRDHLRHVQSQ